MKAEAGADGGGPAKRAKSDGDEPQAPPGDVKMEDVPGEAPSAPAQEEPPADAEPEVRQALFSTMNHTLSPTDTSKTAMVEASIRGLNPMHECHPV